MTDGGFWDWAWARHANVWSWYIRPLFFVPYCYFAYRRNLGGLVATVVALLTSMFWFPAPASPDPRVLAFLQIEQEYLLGEWSLTKALLWMTVPSTFVALALAFWYRRWQFGVAVLVLAAGGKVLWSLRYAGPAGEAVVAPAVIGLLVCVAAVLVARRVLSAREGGGRSR